METTPSVATDILRVDVPEQFIALFGIREENMRLFREELDVDIYAHGGEVTLSGDPEKVELARLTLEKLLEIIQRGDPVDRTRIRYAIELASEGNADRIGEIMRDVIAITHRGRQVKCKTLGQKQYVDAIKQNTCTFAVGPAGTGKTYLAIAMAVVALKSKDVERIILTRPAVEAGEKLGFLPGDLQSKVDPYLRPLYDALYEIMGADSFLKNMEKGLIEVAPLAYMRGRTLDNAYIILDEAQNTTPAQMKMFLTRIGFGSKVIVTGAASQKDLPSGAQSGLEVAMRVLSKVEDIGFCELTSKDVVRHPLVQKIVQAYDNYEKAQERRSSRKERHDNQRRR